MSHCCGRFYQIVDMSCQMNWILLTTLSYLGGKKTVLNHEGQDLISSAKWLLIVCRRGRILTRRLRDACQKRRLVGILGGERFQRNAEIILRCRSEAITAISQVDETGVTRE